jgi:hypothetical protein
LAGREANVNIVAGISGLLLILIVLWEGFETIVLPRRVTRRFRLTRFFYRHTWLPWSALVRSLASAKHQETLLSVFGPLSLLLLLSVWAGALIAGFALLHFSLGSALHTSDGATGLFTDLYLSGTTFFTLGLGDVVPRNDLARCLVVLESGMGFGFLALVIGYLPGMNQSFARREVSVSLLDARAGSPPAVSEMLRRHGYEHGMEALRQLLKEWEKWSAEFLEAHLSYPVLAYFRSQHDNQSWLAALTTILDTCALVMVGVEGACERQAELTFAMARHAVVDLSLVFRTGLQEPAEDRLPPAQLAALRELLAASGVKLRIGADSDEKLAHLRWMYEPYVFALARYFHTDVPSWIAEENRSDNWQTSVWDRRGGARKSTGSPVKKAGEHFHR